MISTNIGQHPVNLPELEKIAGPKTRKAVAHGLATKMALAEAMAARDAADDVRFKIESTVEIEQATAYELDPSAVVPDSRAKIEAAQRDADEKATRAAALGHALPRSYAKIREAVIEEIPIFAKVSLVDSVDALGVLVSALDTARDARDALYSSLGVGGMCARLLDDPSAPIAIQHLPRGYHLDVDVAIAALEEGLAKAADELDALRGLLKPATAKKRRKSAGDAPVAPTEPTAPPVADPIVFDIGFDDEDDDE